MRASSVCATPDPNVLVEMPVPANWGYRDLSSRVLRPQTLDPTKRNAVLICAGQSNMTNISPSTYTAFMPAGIDNFNPYDGAIYSGFDPMVGCSNPTGGCPMTRLADKLLVFGIFDRVIIAPIAINGTTATDWSAGNLTKRIETTVRRLAARGLTATAILWGQGETVIESSPSYQTVLGQVIANSRTAGFFGPWFVAKQTFVSGAIQPAVQAQQVAIVNPALGIWAGADADSLGLPNRQGDGTHWNDAGSENYAQRWQTALAAYGPPFA